MGGPPAENRPFLVEIMKIFKNGWTEKPSPSPTTPPIPYDFIVFTLTTSKSLVECSISVFSCIVFIRVCEDEKTFKKPRVNRVKSFSKHDKTANYRNLIISNEKF